jgi:hypothetical protein
MSTASVVGFDRFGISTLLMSGFHRIRHEAFLSFDSAFDVLRRHDTLRYKAVRNDCRNVVMKKVSGTVTREN